MVSKWLLKIRFFSSVVLMTSILGLSYNLIVQSQLQQIRKYDHANINHMKYGLFSVNRWKEKLTDIVLAELEDFEITASNKVALNKHVQGQLDKLIDKVDIHIRKTNSGSAIGWLKQQFINAFVDVKDVKEGIPEFTKTIVSELTKNSSQKMLKQAVRQKVKKYISETFSKMDTAEINDIVTRTGKKNRKQAMVFLEKEVEVKGKLLFQKTWLLLFLSLLLFAICIFPEKKLDPVYFSLAVVLLSTLLLVSVVCPMIDMDAKITDFGFNLLGHSVHFENQTVYFQSKSVLDVFMVLIKNPELPMKFVGVLMVLFSIFFPVVKLASSLLYYFEWKELHKNSIVKFFVLKSGKWSVADVQVVAIMMAYIGFNGMISAQFDSIRQTIPKFDLVSTNGTTLQIGFFLFLAYVILALIFSSKIERTH